MEPVLVPLFAALIVAALAIVAAGKARALYRTRDAFKPRQPRRDRHWRSGRGVLLGKRRRRRETIVIPPGTRL